MLLPPSNTPIKRAAQSGTPATPPSSKKQRCDNALVLKSPEKRIDKNVVVYFNVIKNVTGATTYVAEDTATHSAVGIKSDR